MANGGVGTCLGEFLPCCPQSCLFLEIFFSGLSDLDGDHFYSSGVLSYIPRTERVGTEVGVYSPVKFIAFPGREWITG